MSKADICPLFSKVLYSCILDDLDLPKINQLLEKINFKKSEADENMRDVHAISEMSTDMQILDSAPFKFLKQIIKNEFKKYKNNILQYRTTHFKLTTSWITRSGPGQASNYHNHSNCLFSGVLYLSTPTNSGGISFLNYFNKETIQLIPTKYNIYNANKFVVQPQERMIIFFPSEVHHRILPNESNEVRFSLAFNFFPTGAVGNKGNDGFLNVKVI